MAKLVSSTESGINCPTYEMEEGDDFDTVMGNALRAHGMPVCVTYPAKSKQITDSGPQQT
jgi:hypothetical protein